MSNENNENKICCEDCVDFWSKYKYHIIAKGSIGIAILSSTFTVLDAYFPHYALAKYISLGALNLGIVLSGYAFGQIEVKADLLDIENKSLQNDKGELIKRLTVYNFPTSTQNDYLDNEELSKSSTSTALPSPFNAEDYLKPPNNSPID